MERTAIALALLLAGCATTPEPVIRTVEVKVAVPTPCIAADDVPARPTGLGKRPADQGKALSLALAKLLEWDVYGTEADGKLKACATPAR